MSDDPKKFTPIGIMPKEERLRLNEEMSRAKQTKIIVNTMLGLALLGFSYWYVSEENAAAVRNHDPSRCWTYECRMEIVRPAAERLGGSY